MAINIKQLRDRDFSKYCELRVAAKLMELGWNVYAPILDRYIDLVAVKEICSTQNCEGWNKQNQKCTICGSITKKEIIRTIQVKGSRIELEGHANSYGIDHRPKDLVYDSGHFFIWVLYDESGIETFVILSPNEFVKLQGTGIHTLTWRANRGRFHPHSDLVKIRSFVERWTILTKEITDDVSHDIINAQETDNFWKQPFNDIREKWRENNEKVLQNIPAEMYDIIDRKTPVRNWKSTRENQV